MRDARYDAGEKTAVVLQAAISSEFVAADVSRL